MPRRAVTLSLCGVLALLLEVAAVAGTGKVQLPKPLVATPIEVRASVANHWKEKRQDVWILQGNCVIHQGIVTARSDSAVIWAHRTRDGLLTNKLTVFLEGNVDIRYQQGGDQARLTDANWYGEFETTYPPKYVTPQPGPEPSPKPPVYHHAMLRRNAYRDGAIRRTQFTVPADPGGVIAPGQDTVEVTPLNVPPPGSRRLQVFAGTSAQIDAEITLDDARNEWVAIIKTPINILVDGLDEFGSIDVSTDRMVIWTSGVQAPNVPGETSQSADQPLEFYMEGNIVFRQGERVIYADRMYYDVRGEVGVIFKAELLTPVQNYLGTLRLRADVIQQLAQGRFQATNAYVTSSRLGVPGYRLAADEILVEDIQQPLIDPLTGEPAVDPLTGEPVVHHQRLATSRNNVLLVSEIPIFYWPVLATDLEDPNFYIRRLALKNDSIFGTQIYSTWDGYQIFGISDPPEGTDWDFSVDYLSERGLGHGTKFAWNRGELFGIPGPNAGFVDYWGIQDHGLDNLGLDRRAVVPEKDYRFRLLGRHRWNFAEDWQLTSQLGWISDRNFLEQYFEYEWDTFKDLTTGVQLKHIIDNNSLSIAADARINSFFNEMDQVPRFDFFTIGQPLLGDLLTWHQHTSLGYLRMHTPTTPEDPAPAPAFKLLPWEADVGGGRFVTRHELDLPFEAGPFKIVPRALGELAHWGEALDGEDLDRAYGQLGVKITLPVWGADPTFESRLLDVHGLAHKVNFELDASYSDATRDLSELPLYDPLDDNSIEAFRRRFQFTTFGGTTPLRFDERFYALRSGLGDWVTGPAEIADDLAAVRFNVDQRWQTKRGIPGQRRLQDWIELSTGVTWFPNDDRDNFGEDFGLLNYDFKWHLGERTTFLSRGIYDFFGSGQALTRVGFHLKRPPRGDMYVGFRSLDGPIDSKVLLYSHSYRMSPKWISRFSTGYDFGDNKNIGQQFSIIRIGESFLMAFGFTIDASKDVFGINFSLEPRFVPNLRLGTVSGAQIPPAGAFGLE